MINKKYIMTDETKIIDGRVLHRIRATCDFGNVKTGDFGGWIEDSYNLSCIGNCWVYQDAYVYDGAYIRDDAKITLGAKVYGLAEVQNEALICGATISGDAVVSNRATVFGEVRDSAQIKDNAVVRDGAIVCGGAIVGANTVVGEGSFIASKLYGFEDGDIFSTENVDRWIVEERISSSIIKQTACFAETTVFSVSLKSFKAEKKYSSKAVRYVVSNPLANIEPQICYSMDEATEMEQLLHQFRHHISKATKCFGYGWRNSPPSVAIMCNDGRRHCYSYAENKYKGFAFTYQGSNAGIATPEHELIVSRWLTVNKKHSTNKRMLSITDWLCRR